jgi:putative membrane protein
MRLAKLISVGVLRVAITLAALETTSLAHPGEQHIDPQNWTRAWSWEPGVVVPVILTLLLYAIGVSRIYARNRRNPAIPVWQIVTFAAGWFTLVVALNSPLHKMGSVLFSAHMSQHELLMVVAAPLLVLGRPLIPFLFAMPERVRERLGTFSRLKAVRSVWLWITGPLIVWAIHGITLWIWHLPSLYQATLDRESIHAAQHTTFLVSALLFWWTLIHGRYGRLGYGVAFLYVFTTALHTSILGALLTFAQQLWYPIYEGRTLPWNLTALEDQQLGGLIMWIPSGTVFIVVGLAMFAAWIGESEKRAQYSYTHEIAKMPAGGDRAR